MYLSLLSYYERALCDDISSEHEFVIVVIFQYKCDVSIIDVLFVLVEVTP